MVALGFREEGHESDMGRLNPSSTLKKVLFHELRA